MRSEIILGVVAIGEGIQALGAIAVLCYWHRNLTIARESHAVNKEQLELSKSHNLRAQELHDLEVDYRKAAIEKLGGK